MQTGCRNGAIFRKCLTGIKSILEKASGSPPSHPGGLPLFQTVLLLTTPASAAPNAGDEMHWLTEFAACPAPVTP